MTDTNAGRGVLRDEDALSRADSYKFGTDHSQNTFKMSVQSAKFRLKTATQLKKEKSEIPENGGLLNQIGQAIISKTKAIRRIIPNQNNTTTTSIVSNKPKKIYPKTPISKKDETHILSGVKRPFGLIEKETHIETCVAPTSGKKTKQVDATTSKQPKAKRSLSFGNLYSDFFKNDEQTTPKVVASNTPLEMNVDGDVDSFQTVVYKNNKRKQNSDSKNNNKKLKDVDSETPVSKSNNPNTEIRAQSSRPTPPKKTTKAVTKCNSPEQSKAPPKNTTSKQNRSNGGPDPNLKNDGPRRRIPQGLQIVITSEGDNSLTAIGYAKGKPIDFKQLVCKALGTHVNQIVHQTAVKSEGKVLMTLTGDTKQVAARLELEPLKIKIQTNVTFTVALKSFAYIIKGVDTSSDLKELKTSIDKLNNITLLNVKFLGKPANIQNKHRAALYFETETKTQAENIVYSSCAYQGDWGRKRYAALYLYDPTRYVGKNKQKEQHTEISAELPKKLSANTTQQNARVQPNNAPNHNMVIPPTPTPTLTPTTQYLEGRPSKQSTYNIPTDHKSFRDTNIVSKGQNTILNRGGPRPNHTHHTSHTSRQPLLPTPVFNAPGANKHTQYERPYNAHYQAERRSKQPLLPTPLDLPGTNKDEFIGHLLVRLDQQHWQMIHLQRQVNMLLFHLEGRDHNSYSRYSGTNMHIKR